MTHPIIVARIRKANSDRIARMLASIPLLAPAVLAVVDGQWIIAIMLCAVLLKLLRPAPLPDAVQRYIDDT